MEKLEKHNIQIRMAICLNRIIRENKMKSQQGATNSNLIDALRQLESTSGISYPILQKISKGNRNPQLTTIISIIESFEMRPSDFFQLYENVTAKDIAEFKRKLEQEKVGGKKSRNK